MAAVVALAGSSGQVTEPGSLLVLSDTVHFSHPFRALGSLL